MRLVVCPSVTSVNTLPAGGEEQCTLSKFPVVALMSNLLRKFEKAYRRLILVETWMDLQAFSVKMIAWTRGLYRKGFAGAHLAASGLAL